MHWGYYGQYGRIVVNVFPSKLRRLLGPSGKGKVFCLRAWMDFCFPPMFPSSLHLITPKEGHCSYALNKTASVIPPLLFSFVYWWHSLIMYNLPQGENSLSATKWQFTVYVLSYACTLKHPRFIVLKQTMMTSCSLLTPKVTWRFFSPSPPIGQMQGLRGNPLLWALWQNASSSINLQRLGYQEGIAGKIKHCCQ